MAKLTEWFKQTVGSLVDPERESRIQGLERAIRKQLSRKRREFSLGEAVAGIEHTQQDLEVAVDRSYRRVLERAWADEQLTSSERDSAEWLAEALAIPPRTVSKINIEFAQGVFGSVLARAMEDGVLDPHEQQHLEQIASSIGCSMPQLARRFFQHEAEGFLRGVFMICVQDGHISDDEWAHLLNTTETLGLSRSEMLTAIQPQAQQFVEHVLADAKADRRLSETEESTLNWLIDNLGVSLNFRNYVEGELRFLKQWTMIQDGVLPSIAPPASIETRAGELIHFHGKATWMYTRHLKSGPITDRHHGTLTMTDTRLIFSSPSKSQTMNYRRVISHRGNAEQIEAQLDGKPVSTFVLNPPSPISYVIFRAAVGMANQTKVATADHSRHIPRDVRQRVWQRYGGRCVECSATDYLEFDHVIPVAKGGSNAENNVQLLCRRCNQKKSDKI